MTLAPTISSAVADDCSFVPGKEITITQICALAQGDDATRKAIEAALEECGWVYRLPYDAYHKVAPDRMEAYQAARSRGFV